MKLETRERIKLALYNASEFIRSHVEHGLEPEDVNEENEKGLLEYNKACYKASKIIENIAKKYE